MATPPLVSPLNDVRETSAEIPPILMTRHYPDPGCSSDWMDFQPIRSTAQIWVVTRHQYGISALVSLMSFRGQIRDGVAKCGVFPRLNMGRSVLVSFIMLVILLELKKFSAERNSALEPPLLYIEIVVIVPEMNN